MNRMMVVAGVVCVCLAARPVHASLIIEASVGERPAKADEYMNTLRAIFVHDFHESIRAEDVIAHFRNLPRPGIEDPSLTATKIIAEIEVGYKNVLQGNFKAASAALRQQLDVAHDNPGLLVADPNGRSELVRALVGLGISLNRIGDTAGSAAAFEELARSTAAQPLRGFGSEAERLYGQASTALLKLPRGKLLLSVSEPDAQIFVDEVGSGRGGTFSADMIPGPYRILIMVKDRSLRYDVVVTSNQETKLDIDWQLETALVVTPSSISLRLRSEEERRRLPDYIARLADRAGSEQSVTVFSLTTECNRIAMTGARFDRDRHWQQARRGKIFIAEPHTVVIRLLALYIMKNEPSPQVHTEDDAANGPCPAEDPTPDEPSEQLTSGTTWMKWTGIAGIGAGLVGGGLAIKFALDSKDAQDEFDRVCAVMCTSQQANGILDAQASANRNAKIAGIAGGVAVLTGGVFLGLWFHSRHSTTVAVVPSSQGSMAEFSFSF